MTNDNLPNTVSSFNRSHAAEVQDGERFEFGKNWQSLLATVTNERIAIAEQALVDFLQIAHCTAKRSLISVLGVTSFH